MRNFLVIHQGVVVGIVEKPGNFQNEDFTGVFDTVAEDDSRTFKIGDAYSVELLLERNRELWIAKGWLSPENSPVSVSMRQARLALYRYGLLAQVDAAITDPEARIEWEYATTVERISPLVQNLAAGLGLTEQQLDDLFALAATL